mmetsp:Transcript_41287/g.90083  ORF Transcript_41287/g.90083 Transcript_41287/m.90083 type:complete len:272 (-) Transcript_41287:1734-2549(-)
MPSKSFFRDSSRAACSFFSLAVAAASNLVFRALTATRRLRSERLARRFISLRRNSKEPLSPAIRAPFSFFTAVKVFPIWALSYLSSTSSAALRAAPSLCNAFMTPCSIAEVRLATSAKSFLRRASWARSPAAWAFFSASSLFLAPCSALVIFARSLSSSVCMLFFSFSISFSILFVEAATACSSAAFICAPCSLMDFLRMASRRSSMSASFFFSTSLRCASAFARSRFMSFAMLDTTPWIDFSRAASSSRSVASRVSISALTSFASAASAV